MTKSFFNTIHNMKYWNDISIQFQTRVKCYIQRYLLFCNMFNKILIIYHLRSIVDTGDTIRRIAVFDCSAVDGPRIHLPWTKGG